LYQTGNVRRIQVHGKPEQIILVDVAADVLVEIAVGGGKDSVLGVLAF